jgi:predicted phosphate transport protein (TIGR00153 family)
MGRTQGDEMLNLFQALMPKESRFFDLFARHAETLVGGAEVMSRMFAERQAIDEACRQISNYETQADGVTRDVLHAVRRTFITPFDRSAITDLISSMDDAIDEMQKTAKAITQFEVTSFEPQMCEMAALSEKAAHLVAKAMPLLRSVGSNHDELDTITEQIVHLEEDADNLHDSGLKALFQANREGNAMGYIVGREIYSHLEKVLDRFEDVANEISGIVIDHG